MVSTLLVGNALCCDRFCLLAHLLRIRAKVSRHLDRLLLDLWFPSLTRAIFRSNNRTTVHLHRVLYVRIPLQLVPMVLFICAKLGSAVIICCAVEFSGCGCVCCGYSFPFLVLPAQEPEDYE